MKLLRVCVVFSVLFLSEFFIACRPVKTTEYTYYFRGVELMHLDNSGEQPVEAVASAKKQAYGIRVSIPTGIKYMARGNALPATFLVQTARATSRSQETERYVADTQIESIKIFTLYDFDEKLPAGSEITDLFMVYEAVGIFTEVEDRVNKIKYKHYSREAVNIEFDALLMSAPTMTLKHRFRVEVGLADGSTLTGETTGIELL